MKEATDERILVAAMDAFGTRGYDGTSLDDLARDLGIRKQTILYWFPSKEALLAAVVDRCADEVTRRLVGGARGRRRRLRTGRGDGARDVPPRGPPPVDARLPPRGHAARTAGVDPAARPARAADRPGLGVPRGRDGRGPDAPPRPAPAAARRLLDGDRAWRRRSTCSGPSARSPRCRRCFAAATSCSRSCEPPSSPDGSGTGRASPNVHTDMRIRSWFVAVAVVGSAAVVRGVLDGRRRRVLRRDGAGDRGGGRRVGRGRGGWHRVERRGRVWPSRPGSRSSQGARSSPPLTSASRSTTPRRRRRRRGTWPRPPAGSSPNRNRSRRTVS